MLFNCNIKKTIVTFLLLVSTNILAVIYQTHVLVHNKTGQQIIIYGEKRLSDSLASKQLVAQECELVITKLQRLLLEPELTRTTCILYEGLSDFTLDNCAPEVHSLTVALPHFHRRLSVDPATADSHMINISDHYFSQALPLFILCEKAMIDKIKEQPTSNILLESALAKITRQHNFGELINLTTRELGQLLITQAAQDTAAFIASINTQFEQLGQSIPKLLNKQLAELQNNILNWLDKYTPCNTSAELIQALITLGKARANVTTIQALAHILGKPEVARYVIFLDMQKTIAVKRLAKACGYTSEKVFKFTGPEYYPAQDNLLDEKYSEKLPTKHLDILDGPV